MKKRILAILLTFVPAVAFAADQSYYDKALSDISPINSIILLCDSSEKNACNDESLWALARQTHIRFVSRHTLGVILNELQLQSSGLTAAQTAKIGKLSGASHILLYNRKDANRFCYIEYSFKLVNISTSHIEYSENTCILTEYGKEKGLGKVHIDPETYFSILNTRSYYHSIDEYMHDRIKEDEGSDEAERYMKMSSEEKKEYMKKKGYKIKKSDL